jgi:hypothetical protein
MSNERNWELVEFIDAVSDVDLDLRMLLQLINQRQHLMTGSCAVDVDDLFEYLLTQLELCHNRLRSLCDNGVTV